MGDNSSPRRWSHQASDFNCGRECHNALATILDRMEVEKKRSRRPREEVSFSNRPTSQNRKGPFWECCNTVYY